MLYADVTITPWDSTVRSVCHSLMTGHGNPPTWLREKQTSVKVSIELIIKAYLALVLSYQIIAQ